MKKLRRAVLALALVLLMGLPVLARQLLIPGGQIVGLHLEGGQLTVVSFSSDQARMLWEAGVQPGDEILALDGQPIHKIEQLQQLLQRSDGEVRLTVRRGQEEKQLSLHPQITAEGPRLGLYLREGVSGIGTVTWYDPHTAQYGALGHGIKNEDGAAAAGELYPACVASVKKGRSGAPGQLRGRLRSQESCGSIDKNEAQGVFGSSDSGWLGEPLPVASREEIHTGRATIRSTVTGTEPREYDVEIVKIYPEVRKNGRNMLLKITDPALLEVTGGIVQGMSGSPIIQDGRLVGAVTHVLINDPTRGYGIFIENMLEAAE